MAVKQSTEPLQGAGIGTRLRTLAIVLFNVGLALTITVGLGWLSGRPGLRQRIDLTAEGENTLDVQLQALLDQLEGKVEFHVFFRPFDPWLQDVGARIQERMFEILLLAEERNPEKVELVRHPYAPPGMADGVKLLETMRSFGISESNSLVVASKDRHAVVKLLGDVAEIEIGNPIRHQGNFRPPSLRSFIGQEALAKAILKATQGGSRPLALFSKGHGERAIFSDDDRSMGQLHSALVADGFRVETWDPAEDGKVPEDCVVLAIVGAEEAFSDKGFGWIAEYVRGGGSIIAAPGLRRSSGQGTVSDLLAHFGILVRAGLVCRPVIGADGVAMDGQPSCAGVVLRSDGMLARHPITEHLRRGDRRVRVAFGRALDRGRPPTGGVLLDLMRTDTICWEELAGPDGVFKGYVIDQGKEEVGAFTLAMTSVFRATEVGPSPPGAETDPVRECRVLAVGSPEVFSGAVFDTNRDFLVNSFNWAASREFRISITPRTHAGRRIEIGEDRTLFFVSLIVMGFLPLLCLCAGIFTVWRRRR
jgi:hypothetical protein